MISIVLPDLRGGGAERVMLDLAREFSRLGHTVEFALMQRVGEFLPEAEREFRVFDLSVSRTRLLPLPISRYIRARNPESVISNMWPLTSASVLGRALSLRRCKLLLVEHNTLSQQYSSWGKVHRLQMALSMAATYRFADNVAAVSRGSAIDTARLARLSVDDVSVLHNPIPRRPMPDPEARAMADRLWVAPPGRRILTVGSLKDQKNHRLLFRAFADLGHPEAKLMVVGQGENERPLRALASQLGISNQVIFAGFHPDPSPFYSTADLFALSSDYEGFGNVIVEALSFGLPVVSTECPSGPEEILQNGRFGRLVPVGDAQALTNALKAALLSPIDSAAQKARAADFVPAIAARRYLDILGIK
jgi:glycosyltransferase involved in cell wall biosynthesis